MNVGPVPEGQYPGEYLKDVGAAIAERDGDKWLGEDEETWLDRFARRRLEPMMKDVQADLEALGVFMDVYSPNGAWSRSVPSIRPSGSSRIATSSTGMLEPPKGKTPEDWEPRPQLLFRSSDFGDDVDRPLKKSDGSNTYFANDIAYHLDKAERGTPFMIDVLGADHGGYVKRMKAAVKAITEGQGELDVKLCQLVSLLDGGKPVKMSKRAGTFVTLRDVLEAVGPDVLRFIMLTRRNDQTLEFDYQKVREQSRDNPVFYVQYAHARACSVIATPAAFADDFDAALSKAPMGGLSARTSLV